MIAKSLNGRPGEVVIESISGDDGRLSLEAGSNCAGIAALETMKLLGQTKCGVSLTLHKVGCRGSTPLPPPPPTSAAPT